MKKILIDNKYYLIDDRYFDRIVQDYLITNPKASLIDNSEDIVTYFLDNYIDILDALGIPATEDTDISAFTKGLKEYITYLKS